MLQMLLPPGHQVHKENSILSITALCPLCLWGKNKSIHFETTTLADLKHKAISPEQHAAGAFVIPALTAFLQ